DIQRKYIGELYDDTAQLSYLNARYYNPSTGQFVSQDPVVLSLGTPTLTESLNRIQSSSRLFENVPTIQKKLTAGNNNDDDVATLQKFLTNPQALNAYAYGVGNPIKNFDRSGEAIPILPIIAVYSGAQTLVNLYDLKTVYYDYPNFFTQQQKKDTSITLGIDLMFRGATSATKEIGEKLILEIGPTILDVMDHYMGPQLTKFYNDDRDKKQQNSSQNNAKQNTSSLPETVNQDGASYQRNSSGMLNVQKQKK
ncbi:MAG: RHS repeat-associated core domain-containing protein, partial [Minisyncoccia bacterium]